LIKSIQVPVFNGHDFNVSPSNIWKEKGIKILWSKARDPFIEKLKELEQEHWRHCCNVD